MNFYLSEEVLNTKIIRQQLIDISEGRNKRLGVVGTRRADIPFCTSVCVPTPSHSPVSTHITRDGRRLRI